MHKTTHRSPWLIALLAAALCLQSPVLRAEMAAADDVAATDTAAKAQADADRAKVQTFLERANVKDRLQALGVNGLAAKDRVAAMNDQEVHALAQRIDSLPAGGNLSNSDIIIILLIVILVAIIV